MTIKPNKAFLGCVFVATLVFAAMTVTACTCVRSYAPWVAEFSEANAVFVGKVRSVTPISRQSEDSVRGDRIVTFEVAKKYKGIESSTRLISLYADYDSSSCSFRADSRMVPRRGETWIVLGSHLNSPQMSFGGSCNSSQRVKSKEQLSAIEREAFKFQEPQGIVGSVVQNYMTLMKNVEVSIVGDGVAKTVSVDSEGYFWFPLLQPGKYTIRGIIPFRTSLIGAVYWPETFDAKDSQTIFIYHVDLKAGEYHYNELNVNDPPKDPFARLKKDADDPASF